MLLEYLLYVNFSQLPFEGQHLKNKQVPIHNLKVLQGPDLLSFAGDISAIVWSVALSYPIRYITVTCLVVYVELRFILLNSLSLLLFVLVLFCSVLFLKSCCGLFVAEVFHAWQQACCFFMVIPIENVSKCLWPCSLYGKDIIHHVKQEKNIYCILVYLYNYVIEKIWH